MARGNDDEQTDKAAATTRRAGERGLARRRLPRGLAHRAEALPDWLSDEPSRETAMAVFRLGARLASMTAPSFPADVRRAAMMLRQATTHDRTGAPCARELTRELERTALGFAASYPSPFETFAENVFYAQGVYLHVVSPTQGGKVHLRERVDSSEAFCGVTVPAGIAFACSARSYHRSFEAPEKHCRRCERSAARRSETVRFLPGIASIAPEARAVNLKLGAASGETLLLGLAGPVGARLCSGRLTEELVNSGLRELSALVSSAQRSVVRAELIARHDRKRALGVIKSDCPQIYEDVLVATYCDAIPEPSVIELLELLDHDAPFARDDVLACLFDRCWRRAIPTLAEIARGEIRNAPYPPKITAERDRLYSPSALMVAQALRRRVAQRGDQADPELARQLRLASRAASGRP